MHGKMAFKMDPLPQSKQITQWLSGQTELKVVSNNSIYEWCSVKAF